jgi:hypothetical protein
MLVSSCAFAIFALESERRRTTVAIAVRTIIIIIIIISTVEERDGDCLIATRTLCTPQTEIRLWINNSLAVKTDPACLD